MQELAGRLFDAKGRIRNPASKALGVDLSAAAQAVRDLASIKFAIREIAVDCTDKCTAKELRELLGEGW
jgi:hypothetical protein